MDCFRIRIECGKRIYSNEILAKQLQVFGYLFQITMERFLREAITRFPVEHPLDETVLDTYEQKEAFKKNCRNMEMVDGKIMYKGRRNDWLPIPTPEQLDNLLFKVHVKNWKERESGIGKKHYRGVQLHVEALSNAGWAFPIGMGGLKAVAEE